MNGGPGSSPWSTALRWLAELVPSSSAPGPTNVGPPMATVARRLGAKLALALQLEQAEAIGIDMVHAAVNELLSMHALPQAASLGVAGRNDGGFAEGVVAGIARACRAHDLPIVVPLAVEAATEQVGLCLGGVVIDAHPTAAARGDLVLALRGTGPSDGDHVALLAAASRRGLPLEARLTNGDTIARTLVAPRASHASVMHDPVRLGWHFVGGAIDEGGLVEHVRALLPAALEVQWDFARLRPLAPFGDWFIGPDQVRTAAHTTSVGYDFVLIARADEAAKLLQHFAAWGEPACCVGVVVDRNRPAST